MNELSCTLDTIVAQEERRRALSPKNECLSDGAMQEAIAATCGRISAAFADQAKIVVRLRVARPD